jgi:hypothetical protein
VSLPEHEQLAISVLLDSGLENIFHLGLSLANEIKAKAKTCLRYEHLTESDKHILDAFTSVLPLFPELLFGTDLNVGSRTVSSWSHCNQVLAANSFLDMKQQMEAIHVKN